MSAAIRQIPKPLVVRCSDKMCFKIHRGTYEAITCSYYDAYCFSAPDPAVDYISYSYWMQERNKYRGTENERSK